MRGECLAWRIAGVLCAVTLVLTGMAAGLSLGGSTINPLARAPATQTVTILHRASRTVTVSGKAGTVTLPGATTTIRRRVTVPTTITQPTSTATTTITMETTTTETAPAPTTTEPAS